MRKDGLIVMCVLKKVGGATQNVYFVMDLQEQTVLAYLIPFDPATDRY